MKIDALPYVFEVLNEIKLYGGAIYKILNITNIYGEIIPIKIREDKLTFIILESMVTDSLIKITINYEVVGGNNPTVNSKELDIFVDFMIPIYFECLPFEKVKMFDKI